MNSFLTFSIDTLIIILSLTNPMISLVIAFVTLYLPVLPNIAVGNIEISTQMFALFGLILRVVDKKRTEEQLILLPWQKSILAILASTFLISIIMSESIYDSLILVPNLVTYIIWLYVMMKLIHSRQQLWVLAKTILIMGFILSVWRTELRPLRLIVGLTSLGINGAVFSFHPAVCIALSLILIPPPEKEFSRRWKIFCFITLISTFYHGLLLETRAAWISWMTIIFLIGFLSSTKIKLAILIGVSMISGVVFYFFSEKIETNFNQTRKTIETTLEDTRISRMNPDDQIRLIANQAGIKMFKEKPIYGWGPNAYSKLKPKYAGSRLKAARLPGAFNSWLIIIAEMGILGLLSILYSVTYPIFQSIKYVRKIPSLLKSITFGFALSVLCLSIHLFFIDLFYSFVWAHIGLALSATRIALQEEDS